MQGLQKQGRTVEEATSDPLLFQLPLPAHSTFAHSTFAYSVGLLCWLQRLGNFL